MSPALARRSALVLALALVVAPCVSADTSGGAACGPVSVSQSSSTVPEALSSLACIDDATRFHYDNSWYRAFPAPGPQFEVCAVEISIEEAQSGAGGGQPLTINVYANPDHAFPGNFDCLADQLVGTATIDVADQALSNLVVPVSAVIPAGAEMIVEISVPDGIASQDKFFPGSNSQPQTGPTYVYSPVGCADPGRMNLADLGYPESHLILSVQGTLDDREPAAIAVDAAGNGILDPGELVAVAPAWKNDSGSAIGLTGTASSLTGPGGLTYQLLDSAADYGTIDAGASAGCEEATADCYSIQIDGSTSGHRDAILEETTSAVGTAAAAIATRRHVLHVGGSFADTPPSNIFYPFVENVLHNGVSSGCATPTYFCPASTTLRQQMAVFLLKALLGPCYVPPAATGSFADVPVSNAFAPWIEDLANRGITTGCGPSLYCPSQTVTRKQMAVFLLKTRLGAFYQPPAPTGIFEDVAADSYRPWIEDLYNRGITGGCSGGPPPAPISYCPEGKITRGQMAAFLVKTFGLSIYAP